MNKGLFGAFTPDPNLPKSGFSNLVVLNAIGAAQSYKFPTWVQRAKVTVQGSGSSSGTNGAAASTGGGWGGGTAIAIVPIVRGAVYTYTIPAGGVGPGAGTTANAVSGASATFSGPGGVSVIATGGAFGAAGIGTAGDLLISGGSPSAAPVTSQGFGGGSFLAGQVAPGSAAVGYGGGGPGPAAGVAGNNGFQGVIILEF